MADVMWVKFKVNMYEDTKVKILDSMEKRDLYHYVWARSIVLAGKINLCGYLYITDNMPHTIKTLAIEFNRSVEEVKDAYKILRKLEMIEFTEDKVFKIKNWEKHQNVEGMERAKQLNNKRVAKCRAKKKVITGDIEPYPSSVNYADKTDRDEIINNKDIEEVENTSNNINENNDYRENDKNNSSDENSNVTCNDENSNCNITVMEQNKKEIENKKKNKKDKKEIDKDKNIDSNKNNACDLNNKTSACDEAVGQSSLFEKHNNTKSESQEEEDINLKALELMHYHEKITGKVGGCDYVALRSAIDIHGKKWVKMAMDIGFERNCPDIKYAIGVLKNWRRDGYPEDHMEVKKNGARSTGKSNSADKNEFAGFKPKEPRKLTEAERKRIEANLI